MFVFVVFRSCEITLELMRQYADTLITIIEVFLYDPLYQWQLSPQKALQLQQQFDKTNQDSVAPSSYRSSAKGSMLPPSLPSSSSASNIGSESVTTGLIRIEKKINYLTDLIFSRYQ
jgi:ataxia telangiectasia mutated family protein